MYKASKFELALTYNTNTREPARYFMCKEINVPVMVLQFIIVVDEKHYFMETSIIFLFFFSSNFSTYIKIAQASQRFRSDECFKFKIYLFLIGFEKEINLNNLEFLSGSYLKPFDLRVNMKIYG